MRDVDVHAGPTVDMRTDGQANITRGKIKSNRNSNRMFFEP